MREAEGGRARILSAWAVIRRRWRGWLRAVHRDVGYLVVGLTFIYAISGVAINHVGEWDPNFVMVTTRHPVTVPLPADPDQAASSVLAELGIRAQPVDIFFESDSQLEVYFDNQTIVVDVEAGEAVSSAERPRWFLRVANWLHYNRGKASWTYIADAFAVLLLYLAISGAVMVKGRRGLVGRGALLIASGAAVPLLYVHLSGGP